MGKKSFSTECTSEGSQYLQQLRHASRGKFYELTYDRDCNISTPEGAAQARLTNGLLTCGSTTDECGFDHWVPDIKCGRPRGIGGQGWQGATPF